MKKLLVSLMLLISLSVVATVTLNPPVSISITSLDNGIGS